jgi:2-methylcitrate dehydratase PrpD
MERVRVVPDEAFAQHYPKRWPARVEAVLKNGRTLADLVLDAQGDPPRFGEVDARAKFHRLADGIVGRPAADELAEACLAATERDDALAILCAKFNS